MIRSSRAASGDHLPTAKLNARDRETASKRTGRERGSRIPPNPRFSIGRNGGNISPMKTLKEMITEARQAVPEESPEQVQRRIKSREPLAVIDVRDPDEYRDGHIEGSTNISRGFLEFRVAGAVADPTTPVVLYCQTGLRSVLAAKVLKELGYQNVINLGGGDQKWAQSGLPTGRELPLGPHQNPRFSRHLLLPPGGEKGPPRPPPSPRRAMRAR